MTCDLPNRRQFLASAAGGFCSIAAVSAQQPRIPAVAPRIRCSDPDSRDQDDMAIWIHPKQPDQSTVIAADKAADKLFVYDLAGKTIQAINTPYPGNIDIRYGFPLGQRRVDIVAFNQRDGYKIVVYQVDPDTRRLERIDDDSIRTGECYGGALFRSPKTGKFYFFTTGKNNGIEQWELIADAGKVKGKKVRAWNLGLSEAAVGDDETGKFYIGEESRGVWEVGGEPEDPAPGERIIRVGENGLTGDVEGLAIYYLDQGRGYLLVSNQGSNNFKVYRREGKHDFVGTFAITGARDTDGLDVCNAGLGAPFACGLFACHTAGNNCPVLLTSWEDIAMAMNPPLQIDTTWNRRS